MSKNEHIVTVDEEGCFYCRAVDSRLNYREGQQFCGRGCPCFAESMGGRFVCRYEEGEGGEQPLFPSVPGLDPRLQKAYEYAAWAHRGQTRKGSSVPYFAHIITTMNYMMELTQDVEVLQAAILHDTIEDTQVTFEDLKARFGGRVAELVKAETEDKRRGTPPFETWEIRKRETIAHLKTQSLDVKAITLADKTANTDSLVKEWRCTGDVVWEKFNQTDKGKQEWYFKSVRDELTELNGTGVMEKFEENLHILFG